MFDDSSLEIGDLIFFMDSAKNAEHVAVYIGQRKHVPFIVHVVIKTYKSIMMTRLKPSDEHCSYEVYRPKQSRLAWLAVAILFRWVELQVPYASESKSRLLERRISALTNGDHPTLGRQVQMAFARETFQSHFHQYVEAAYHMYSPRSMHAEGSLGLVGMSCSEAIVYAFNIAELLHNDALICTRSKDIDNGTFIWNTEAYPTESSYLDWARPVLPLDATRIRADSLYHHCNTHLAWRNMGTLTIHPVEALPEETYSKADWIAYTARLFKDAPLKRKEYLTQIPEVSEDAEDVLCESGKLERRSRKAHTPLSGMGGGEGRSTPCSSPAVLPHHALSPAGMLFTSALSLSPTPEGVLLGPTLATPPPDLEPRFFSAPPEDLRSKPLLVGSGNTFLRAT